MAFIHATTMALVLVAGYAIELPHLLSDEFIDLINSKQSTWTAGRNFPINTPMKHIEALMGASPDENLRTMNIVTHHADLLSVLPDNFDPRDKWPNCPTLNEIRDQGSCGSCWAFGAVEAMSDRVCTYSNGTKHFQFSAQDLLSCCSECGSCSGGIPSLAWKYWQDNGIVSGGKYNSSQGCQPYKIPPCEHFVTGEREQCNGTVPTPKCERTCEATYGVNYKKDKMKAKQIYVVNSDDDQIRAELFHNGPVEATFAVYADFLHYKAGVYRNHEGYIVGYHAVKMLGWGVENGTKYWLMANSWNNDWGDKGFFKFVRGEDHCGIESQIVTGEPLLVDRSW